MFGGVRMLVKRVFNRESDLLHIRPMQKTKTFHMPTVWHVCSSGSMSWISSNFGWSFGSSLPWERCQVTWAKHPMTGVFR